MWLCVPEGKPIWQVKILLKESRYQSDERKPKKKQNTQTRVKTWQSESQRNKLQNWQHFKPKKKEEKKKFWKKNSVDLAVILYTAVK